MCRYIKACQIKCCRVIFTMLYLKSCSHFHLLPIVFYAPLDSISHNFIVYCTWLYELHVISSLLHPAFIMNTSTLQTVHNFSTVLWNSHNFNGFSGFFINFFMYLQAFSCHFEDCTWNSSKLHEFRCISLNFRIVKFCGIHCTSCCEK